MHSENLQTEMPQHSMPNMQLSLKSSFALDYEQTS